MSQTPDPDGQRIVPNEVTLAPPTPRARIADGLRALGLDELADAGFPDAGYSERVEYQLTGALKPVQTSDLSRLRHVIGEARPAAPVFAQRRSVRTWPDGSELVGMWQFFKPDEP
ncbi:hypothetical protein [Streptomyces mirabilis]|uniref:hypothetical protein n=1 Tax=Streptomyces mirabilis TaxID=68239 RepID=UPI0033C80B36